jgi:hypothetical protein
MTTTEPTDTDTDTDVEPSIGISIETHIDMTAAEFWPDGPPENWTIDDAVAVIQGYGSVYRWLSEWDIHEFDVDITVTRPNPAWNGDHVLFGEPPKRWFTELRRVFPRFLADRLNPALRAQGPT